MTIVKLDYETFLKTRELTGLLPDYLIRQHVIIKPHVVGQVDQVNGKKIISYGESSFGYDIRLGWNFNVFTPTYCVEIDPLNLNPKAFDKINLIPVASGHLLKQVDEHWLQCEYCGEMFSNSAFANGPCKASSVSDQRARDYIHIPPKGFVLGESIEYFEIPRDITVIALGKSTYARCGIFPGITPLEAGWRGRLTIEVANTTPLPARVYANQGIAQLLFFRGLCDCEVSYAERKDGKGGKYQDQTGLTLPS